MRKRIASGPVTGPVTERHVDLGPGRPAKRKLLPDHRVPRARTSDGGFPPLKGEADR